MKDLSCLPFLYNLVPSVWSERENVIWCYGEGDLERELCIEREIELYKLKRNYDELRKRLEGVKINHIKYLPVEREIENYFDDIFVNDNDLPDVIGEEYKNDETTYLTLTNNTDGDWTIITYVDKFYERLIGNNPINYNGIMN